MMKSFGYLVLTMGLVACAVTPVAGQSLAEIARKEAERRSKLPSSAPVYTNADVKPDPAGNSTAPAPLAAKPVAEATNDSAKPVAAEASAEVPSGSEAGVLVQPRVKRDEQHWRERASLIRTRRDGLRADTAGLQTRIGTLTTEAASASGAEAIAVREQLRQASQDLTRFETELRHMEQEWTNLLERARQEKVPPHWLQ